MGVGSDSDRKGSLSLELGLSWLGVGQDPCRKERSSATFPPVLLAEAFLEGFENSMLLLGLALLLA